LLHVPPITHRQLPLGNEFASGAGAWPHDLSRRKFLKLAGATIALAGASGCTRNRIEKIVPYKTQPEEIIPGKPLYFASALTLGGFARGVLVETHEGRPTKIEGNPDHPASLGATDVFMQAELLTLVDPERSQAVMNRGQVSTWEVLLAELANAAQEWKRDTGRKLRFLTRHETSPTFLDQMERLLDKYPAAKWHEYEPLATRAPSTIYDFSKAEVIVSLGADFLGFGSASLKYARDFAARRDPNRQMNRLYVAESTMSLTGAAADHRVLLRSDELEKFALELAGGATSEIAKAIGEDLHAHAGNSVVVAGEFESPLVQAAGRRLNEVLGNIGVTVDYPDFVSPARDLQELIDDIRANAVETLIIIGGNPVYDAPADFDFANLLAKIPRPIHVGVYQDETSAVCRWHVPLAHELETWSDARAFDGTVTIMQPMIDPLFSGRSRHELLSTLLEQPAADSYEIVRRFWQWQHPTADFEKLWRKSLHDGICKFEPVPRGIGEGTLGNSTQPPPEIKNQRPQAGNSLSLLIRPSSRLYDGRFANNAWLQELPDPLTTVVWDNPAWLSLATAQQLNLVSGDVVNLKFHGRSVRAPIAIVPGQADDCVTLHVGYGRTHAGSIGNRVGFNATTLRTSDAMWGGSGVEIEKTDQHQDLVTTQRHWRMEGRDQVRVGDLSRFRQQPQSIAKTSEPPPSRDESLYPDVPYRQHSWGMTINLTTCIGCGACTIACQAENNIPVVGREQVARGREMHWIRVDLYFEGDGTNARALFQPVPCMHCENAPCELVCPVAATVHSSEGLNQMVYNRCIGTRYCSNNCPYKVRRFNFLEYDANQFEQPPTRKLMRNPNVSVRSRGVMEKCTYCIQRINAVKIEANKANRAIRDGEIIPACAQACPAEAIIFGDINDSNSRVTKLKASPLNYALLAELNARPRTSYLARVRNSNPRLEEHERSFS
jgi:Fe-S-cluster-containing dehydrogenase component